MILTITLSVVRLHPSQCRCRQPAASRGAPKEIRGQAAEDLEDGGFEGYGRYNRARYVGCHDTWLSAAGTVASMNDVLSSRCR